MRVFLVFAMLSAWSLAQSPKQLPEAPKALPPSATAPAVKAESAASSYDNQPFVVQKMVTRYVWQADGTGTRTYAVKVKVQSALGVQAFGQVPLAYNSANEELHVDHVRVIKQDGTVVNAPADSAQEITAPVTREAPMYSDFKAKQVIVPSLAVGDTLDYEFSVATVKSLAPRQFWLVHDFMRDAIVIDEQLIVDVPTAVKINLKEATGLQHTVESASGRSIYTWKKANLSIESDADSGKKKHDKKRAQQDADRHPDVQLTTFRSWKEVGDWYAGLQADRVVPNDAVKAKAQALVADKKTDVEKVQAIYDFVARQFRYVSLSFGVGRYQPHAASEVLSNGYGDCKDKHTLFASMLQAVGIKSDPVLINSARKLDPDVPSPAQFDHVITWIALPAGPVIADVTEEVAPYGMIAAVLRNKQALLVSTGASEIITTPAAAGFEQHNLYVVRGKVNDVGKLEGTAHMELRGDVEFAMRSVFRNVPQAKWGIFARYMQSELGIDGDASDVKISTIGDLSKPFTVDWRFSANNYIDWTNKSVQLKLPMMTMSLPDYPDADKDDDSNDGADLSTKPLEMLQAPATYESVVELDLPARYEVRLPVPVTLTRDYGSFHSTYSKEKNHIVAKRELTLTKSSLPVERRTDYEAFRRGETADEAQVLSLDSTAAAGSDVSEGMSADDLNDAALNALNQGNFDEAASLLQRVVKLEPQHKTAWNNLGRAYLGKFEFAKAEEMFRKQIAINPYDEYSYNNLGQALEGEGKLDDAIAQYKKQIEVNPLDRFAHANLGRMLVNMHKYAEAIPELETATSIEPKAAGLYPLLGSAYAETGKTQKAEQSFDKAVQTASNHMVWNEVAYEMALHNIDLPKALSYAESAVSASESNLRNLDVEHLTQADVFNTASLAAEWDTLGWIYFKQNDLAKAYDYISASWAVEQHGEVGDHLAQIYERQGKTAEAKQAYAMALAAIEPTPDLLQHALKNVGDIQHAKQQGEQELAKSSAVEFANKKQLDGSSDALILLDKSGKVSRAKLLSDTSSLAALSDALVGLQIGPRFPDNTEAQLVSRVTVECARSTSRCTVKKIPIERTRIN